MAALASVNMELHEAAEIDGASRFQRVLHVDLPAILPTVTIMLILRAGQVMAIGFEKAFLMQNDLNLRSSEVISTYVYKVGLASATSDFCVFHGHWHVQFRGQYAYDRDGQRLVPQTERNQPVVRKEGHSMVESRKRSGKTRVQLPASDRIYYAVTGVILTALFLVVLYPLVYILSASFSSPAAVSSGKVVLWPVDFSLKGYRAVLEYRTVGIGYRNTTLYTVVGTFINIVMTMVCAYPLARKTLPGQSWLMLLFSFTMIFSGGMIPSYILMQRLGIINTVWVMLLPGAISVHNMIITRTFIANIPADLLEASQIDGCSDFMYFFKVVLPLSKAVLAVIALYYAVGHWNAYFNAFIYLTNQKLFPLQLFLREVLVMNQVDPQMIIDPEMQEAMQGMQDLLKYSLIVVATVPILCVYPFAQRYFIQGVMIGSLKG